MAGKNEVTLTFAGETEKLERSFDKVGAAARGMSSEVGASARGFDLANEAADGAENKFQGVASTLTGTKDTASGLAMVARGDLFNGLVTAGQGAADLAEGVAYTVIPTIKFLATQAGHTAVAMVQSAGRQVAAWAMLSARALANAARIAAAWVISMGPIAIVAAAVAGLTVVVVKNWSRIRNFITGAAQAVLGFLRRNWPLILGILTGPIGLAVVAIARNWSKIKAGAAAVKEFVVDKFNGLVSFIKGLPGKIARVAGGMWDGIKDAFKAAINWVVGAWNGLQFTLPSASVFGKKIGGFTLGTPDIPYLHSGGVVPGTPGSNVVAMLQAGERVIPRGGATQVHFHFPHYVGSRNELVSALSEAIRSRGGNVQLVLGGRA